MKLVLRVCLPSPPAAPLHTPTCVLVVKVKGSHGPRRHEAFGPVLEEDPRAGIIEEISGGVGRWPRDELGWMC